MRPGLPSPAAVLLPHRRQPLPARGAAGRAPEAHARKHEQDVHGPRVRGGAQGACAGRDTGRGRQQGQGFKLWGRGSAAGAEALQRQGCWQGRGAAEARRCHWGQHPRRDRWTPRGCSGSRCPPASYGCRMRAITPASAWP